MIVFCALFVSGATNFRVISNQEADTRAIIELSQDEILQVRLYNGLGVGTGYFYGPSLNGLILEQVGQEEYVMDNPMPGAPGTQVFYYRPIGKGDEQLTFNLRRSWERDVPFDTVSFNIRAAGAYTGNYVPPKAPEIIELDNGTARALPTHFNWCDNSGCTPVKNQGSCGSCWAFSTVAPFEILIKVKDGITRDLSEQYIVSCNTDGYSCNGGWMVHKYHYNAIPPSQTAAGAVYEADKPYTATNGTCSSAYPHHEKIASYASVSQTTDAMKNAIYTYGPISVAVCANSSMQSYSGGIFTGPTCTTVNHAVALTGWDDTTTGCWYMRNSWGTSWGESGYMRIKYGVCSIGYNASNVVYNSSTPCVVTANFTFTTTANSKVVPFVDSSTASGCTVSAWSWNFGDSTTSSSQNPSHTYTNFGTYTVTLTASSGTTSNSISKQVTVSSTSTGKEIFVGAFSGAGVWMYNPNASSWTQLNASDATLLAVGDFDKNGVEDVVGVYGTLGIWIRYSTGTWTKITGVSNPSAIGAADLDGDGYDDIIGVYGTLGTWVRYSQSGAWAQLHASQATAVAGGKLQ